MKVKDTALAGELQHTVANFNMYVNLPHNFKGNAHVRASWRSCIASARSR